jgi:hypothetical protein
MGKMKVVRRDFIKKNLLSPPFFGLYIEKEYINLIIEISFIDE